MTWDNMGFCGTQSGELRMCTVQNIPPEETRLRLTRSFAAPDHAGAAGCSMCEAGLVDSPVWRLYEICVAEPRRCDVSRATQSRERIAILDVDRIRRDLFAKGSDTGSRGMKYVGRLAMDRTRESRCVRN